MQLEIVEQGNAFNNGLALKQLGLLLLGLALVLGRRNTQLHSGGSDDRRLIHFGLLFPRLLFGWDSAKTAMHGNSFQRKLAIVKDGFTPTLSDKWRDACSTSPHDPQNPSEELEHHMEEGHCADKSQRSGSASFSPERVRVRGRSPAFNAWLLTSRIKVLENQSHLLNLTPSFQYFKTRSNSKDNLDLMTGRIEALFIKEDLKEGGLKDKPSIFPYERLKTTSTNPVSKI
ncbi:hypothetical protein HPP92_012983 [Vanilla planifolia]|uniref:Uncharacterized protein n=1 Tax=Vanilla planifolia TaxID=51239 RepID=A0A835QT77_VANPL|nr:hypothetical protein HPP92_012983 [Vanilla planifolia]